MRRFIRTKMLDISAGFEDVSKCDSIFAFIFLGFAFKRIENIQIKKWTSTVTGILLYLFYVEFVMWKVIWVVLHVLVQCITLKALGLSRSRIMPIITIMLVTAYRLILGRSAIGENHHFDVLMMATTARIFGLCCDMHFTHKHRNNSLNKGKFNYDDYETDPSLMDIIHYVFSFIGLIGGAFYRFRTFEDCINKRFYSKNSDDIRLISKLIVIMVIFRFYLPFHGQYFSLKYLSTDEYWNSSIYDKLILTGFYITGYQIFLVIILQISAYQCEAVGLGIYPVECDNQPGHGPTKNYKEIRKSSNDSFEMNEYDHHTLKSFYVKIILFCPWLPEFIKHWNTTHQYWISCTTRMYLGKYSKNYNLRMTLTMFLSAFWHGLYLGIYINATFFVIGTIVVKSYVDTYEFIKNKRKTAILYLGAMYAFRIAVFYFAMFYFILAYWDNIIRYSNDIYHIPFLAMIVLYVFGNFMYGRFKIKSN